MNRLRRSNIEEHEVPIGHGHSSLFSRSSPPTAAVDAASDQPDERRDYDGDCCQCPHSHWCVEE
ncbi:MAG: hypothetical protein MJE68_07125 [Proteobacteria bacterium]|nr:hypothetical protein [Pseudomonadota bacterium]